jgi:hypothetical protein
MQYLVDKYDKDHKVSYPYGSREYWEVNNWVSKPIHATSDWFVSHGQVAVLADGWSWADARVSHSWMCAYSKIMLTQLSGN